MAFGLLADEGAGLAHFALLPVAKAFDAAAIL